MVKVDKMYLEIKVDDIKSEFIKSKEENILPANAQEQTVGSMTDGYVISFLCNGGKLVGKTYNNKVAVFTSLSDTNKPYYLYQFVKTLCEKYHGELVANIIDV